MRAGRKGRERKKKRRRLAAEYAKDMHTFDMQHVVNVELCQVCLRCIFHCFLYLLEAYECQRRVSVFDFLFVACFGLVSVVIFIFDLVCYLFVFASAAAINFKNWIAYMKWML